MEIVLTTNTKENVLYMLECAKCVRPSKQNIIAKKRRQPRKLRNAAFDVKQKYIKKTQIKIHFELSQ